VPVPVPETTSTDTGCYSKKQNKNKLKIFTYLHNTYGDHHARLKKFYHIKELGAHRT
jgi:hypothetical protein